MLCSALHLGLVILVRRPRAEDDLPANPGAKGQVLDHLVDKVRDLRRKICALGTADLDNTTLGKVARRVSATGQAMVPPPAQTPSAAATLDFTRNTPSLTRASQPYLSHGASVSSLRAVIEEAGVQRSRVLDEAGTSASAAQVSSSSPSVLASAAVARVQRGDLEGAMQIFDEARRMIETGGMLNTVEAASIMRNIGALKGRLGDLDGAAEAYEAARSIRTASGTLETFEGANLLMDIGTTLAMREDLEGAVQAFEEARRIHEATNSLATPLGVSLLGNMGLTKSRLEDLDGALQALEEAKSILTNATPANMVRPEAVMILQSIGAARAHQGRFFEALDAYIQSRRICEAIGTLQTLEGAALVGAIGVTQAQSGDLNGAMASFEEAKRIHEATGTLETAQGVTLMTGISAGLAQRGDNVAADQALIEAQRLYDIAREKDVDVEDEWEEADEAYAGGDDCEEEGCSAEEVA